MAERSTAARGLFEPEHEDFRAAFRQFVAREIVPRYEEWSASGRVDRALWAVAARHGFVGMAVPEEQERPVPARHGNGPLPSRNP